MVFGHARRLHRHLEVEEVEAVHELDPVGGGADERLDRVGELEVAQVLGQRARVDADAQRRPVALGHLDDLGRLLRAADVAGVDAHAVRAGLDGLDRQRVVEVDVGDHGDRRVAHDRLERLDVLLARDGDADDVGAGLGDPADLVHRRPEVRRLGLGHRLDGHGRAAPDGDAADVDLPRGGHASSVRGARRRWRPRRSSARRSRSASRLRRMPDVYGTARGGLRARLASRLAARARARRHERFFALTGLEPGMRIVDIGCGALGLRGLEPGLDITGVDVARAPATRAVRPGRRHPAPALRRRRLRPRLQLQRGRARRPRRGARPSRARSGGWPAAGSSRRRRGRSRSSPTPCCPSRTGCRHAAAPLLAAGRRRRVGGHRAAAPRRDGRPVRRAGPRRAPGRLAKSWIALRAIDPPERLIHSPHDCE